jgi:hypothetical protein
MICLKFKLDSDVFWVLGRNGCEDRIGRQEEANFRLVWMHRLILRNTSGPTDIRVASTGCVNCWRASSILNGNHATQLSYTYASYQCVFEFLTTPVRSFARGLSVGHLYRSRNMYRAHCVSHSGWSRQLVVCQPLLHPFNPFCSRSGQVSGIITPGKNLRSRRAEETMYVVFIGLSCRSRVTTPPCEAPRNPVTGLPTNLRLVQSHRRRRRSH